MKARAIWIAAGILIACTPVSSANGQKPTERMQVTGDTSAARVVMTSIFEQLAGDAAQAARAESPRPWLIRFPADSLVDWRAHAANVLRVVRGTVATEADTLRFWLEISEMRIDIDELVVTYTIGGSARVNNKRRGSSTTYEVRALPAGRGWMRPNTKAVRFTD